MTLFPTDLITATYNEVLSKSVRHFREMSGVDGECAFFVMCDEVLAADTLE